MQTMILLFAEKQMFPSTMKNAETIKNNVLRLLFQIIVIRREFSTAKYTVI